MTTTAERQETYRARMRAKGYTQVCEWVPTRDVYRVKELISMAKLSYGRQGEPDKAK